MPDLQLADGVAQDPQRPWRAMFRVECTGGNVEDAFEGQRTYQPERILYAEGDSWFDKFTPIPTSGTNLLDAIRLPFVSVVVDVSKIGSEAGEMVSGQQARQTRAMFDLMDFDAILLSAGGNDLKNLFAERFRQRAEQKGNAPWSQQELDALATPANYAEYFQQVCGHIEAFVRMRDNGRYSRRSHRTGRPCPIFLHGYDYLQPRPAAASVFAGTALGTGPWLFPEMLRAGLMPHEMRRAADAVVDQLNRLLDKLCGRLQEVHYLDQRGLLEPASALSTGPDAGWLDEIHPNRGGFEKLARNRWNVPVARALGWEPRQGELVAADVPVNQTTALA